MPDREKVIKGLECHIHPFQCNDCPYWDKSQPLRDCDVEQMAKDALALLTDTTSWIKEPNRRNHMTVDIEKVIEGLMAIQDEAYDRWVHRQYIEDPLITLIRDNIPDALTLLRKYEKGV